MMGQVEQWRLFIAVPLPDAIKALFEGECGQLRTKLAFRKWVNPADYHITIQFLGDTELGQLTTIGDKLRQGIKGFGPLQLEIGPYGTFGRTKHPSVLWADVQGDLTRLTELQSRITRAMALLGFQTEKRPYRPHITLARKYDVQEAIPIEALDIPTLSESWIAESIVVYRTHMNRQPMYEAVDCIPL